ncbi:MAG: S-layer homology domain-containing protein [Syntrophomonas sp.]
MNIKGKPLLVSALMIIMLLAATGAAGAADKGSTGAEKSETSKQQFSDVDSKSSNAIYINYLADRQVISGYPDGAYHPQEALTRAQAAVILVKAGGLEISTAKKKRI